MDCPNQSFNKNNTLNCSLLADAGIIQYAGIGNPNYPCDRCKANWIKDQVPTAEAPGPILYGILTLHRAQQQARAGLELPAPASDPQVVAVAAAPDGQAKGCGGCGGLSQGVKDLMTGKKKPRGLNR